MSLDLNSAVLRARLRGARADAGISQQEVADRLGVARTTVIAIENGQRRLQAEELLALSKIYGQRLEVLLREAPAQRSLAAQFRLANNRVAEDEQLRAATQELQALVEDYVALERTLGVTLPTHHPIARPVPTGDLEQAAALLAGEERRRLGVGDGPLPHLREVLEAEVGMRVFAIDMPDRLGGLFAFDEELGACVAMNARHRWERQRWSLGHEYAHFLTRRDRPEVTVTLDHYRRVPASERFADHFARHLLLPADGLIRRWQTVSASGRPTVASLVSQADWWGVSLQAFVLRLEQLRLVKGGTYDSLLLQGLSVDEARAMIGLPAREPDTEVVPRRMQALAITAYADGQLSEERLTAMLRVDRLRARTLVNTLLPAGSAR